MTATLDARIAAFELVTDPENIAYVREAVTDYEKAQEGAYERGLPQQAKSHKVAASVLDRIATALETLGTTTTEGH